VRASSSLSAPLALLLGQHAPWVYLVNEPLEKRCARLSGCLGGITLGVKAICADAGAERSFGR
jgi:hypothetical protein